MQHIIQYGQWAARRRTRAEEFFSSALISSCCRLALIGGLFFILAVAAKPETTDGSWPRTIGSNGTRIDVYQPQVDKWEGGKLEDRVALAVTEKATGRTTYGMAWLSARTTIDQSKRLVTLYDMQVKKITISSAGEEEPVFVQAATDALKQWNMTIALDRLLADMAITQNEDKSTGDQLSNSAPKIFIRENPAVLILVDGEPVLQQVPQTNLMRVVNTPALLVLDQDSGMYFLRGDNFWMTAANIGGPWSAAHDTPDSLEMLLQGEQSNAGSQGNVPSEVIVSTEPAELLQINGEPQFSPIDGTRLLYVVNTDSDIFMDLAQSRYYILLSGRWFTAPGLNGPWAAIAWAALPVDFSRIPGGHPKSSVLASVPGTPEARDAIVAAQVPHTATIDRKQAAFTATYDGGPEFKAIGGTGMSYAVNSPNDIIKARGRYYAVSDGVWFVADSPFGPWMVCDFVPPEIYTIPPTVPVYHVKYVYVYDSTPDWVYVGYTPGYFGAFVWDGVVVYGTGFYYPSWYRHLYFGWPWTWGFGFHYGYWGNGFFWRPWYPRVWYWHHERFEHEEHRWWGRVLYNRSVERNRNEAALHHGTVYERWKAPAVIARPAVPVRAPGRIAPRAEMIAPRNGGPRRDLYVGHDGQIYSHQTDGWYRRNGQQWERLPSRSQEPPIGQVPPLPHGQPPPGQVPPYVQPQPHRQPPSGQVPPQPHIQPPTGQAPPNVQPHGQPPIQQVPPQQQPHIQAPIAPPVREHQFEELERDRQARIQGQNRVNQYQQMPPPARTMSPPPWISTPRQPAPSQAPGPRMSVPNPGPRTSMPNPGPRIPQGGGRRH